jgi:signal transduction histidine kinase
MLEYNPQSIHVKGIVDRNVALFMPNAEQKQITLKISIPEEVIVYADFNMVDTVIRNLVSNALKFTHPGGTVDVSVRQDEKYIEVSVSDTGIGIAREHLSKLFRIETKYKKSGTAREKGTGLGLILCKELVEKNGGTIWVESEVGKGTTFRVTLPRAH